MSNSNTGADQQDRKGTFKEIARGCYAFCVESGSNTGVVVGERGVLVVDAQPTAALSEQVLEEIAKVTDKPVKHLVMTHFHVDSGLGAGTFEAGEIVSSELTKRMIQDRGEADRATALTRFSEIFAGGGRLPVSPKPTMSFASSMSIDLGGKEVRLMHLGRGHTVGDVVVWVPDAGVVFAGDLVAVDTAAYCGDAHLTDWPKALDRINAFRPEVLLPGRGRPMKSADRASSAIAATKAYVELLRDTAAACIEDGKGLRGTFKAVKAALDADYSGLAGYEDTLAFNVARAYDEAHGLDIPQVWTTDRDRDLADALRDVIAPADIEEVTEPEASEEALAIAELEPLDVSEVMADLEPEAVSEDAPDAEDRDEVTTLGERELDIVLDLSIDDIAGETQPETAKDTPQEPAEAVKRELVTADA